MDIAIAVQGFVGKDFTFSPKEIALFGTNENVVGYWLLKPPCDFTTLSAFGRHENLSRTRTTEINWFDGESDEACVIKVLRDIALKSRFILTSGKESCEYLEKILCRPINDVSRHPFWHAFINQLPASTTTCIHHCLQGGTGCALQTAREVKKWIRNKDEFMAQKKNEVEVSKTDRVPREPEIDLASASWGLDVPRIVRVCREPEMESLSLNKSRDETDV